MCKAGTNFCQHYKVYIDGNDFGMFTKINDKLLNFKTLHSRNSFFFNLESLQSYKKFLLNLARLQSQESGCLNL